jgi:quinolinate synthase
VVTESGILHKMKQMHPDKLFIPAPANASCACNDCPHMKLNTLEKIWVALQYETPEIFMEEDLRLRAFAPIRKMLDLSK